MEDVASWRAGWREYVWGGFAGAFGETLMHPVDTLKTRIQSGGQFIVAHQGHNEVGQALRFIWSVDGVRGFYRGVVPSFIGSLVTGATYFGFIETTKDWLEYSKPSLTGPWAHFLAGAIGEGLGSVVYVPCEVIKQRMQLQGSCQSWSATMAKINKSSSSGLASYMYYTGVYQAGRSILQKEGFGGLYSGYFSTLARDVPFAGLQIMFYEGFREALEYSHEKKFLTEINITARKFSSFEELVMGGIAGGVSAFLTTPLDVIKTRLQVQGSTHRYKGWADAAKTIWKEENIHGFFRGVVPRVVWFVPASAVTFMSFEWLRKQYQEKNIDSAQKCDVGLGVLTNGSVSSSPFLPHPFSSHESRQDQSSAG
ncbi:hypothetical protein Mapa_004688 [Marchantia paleacea]|nr:hypothetical protein Mapa_004688 [Marchantia paleacea]